MHRCEMVRRLTWRQCLHPRLSTMGVTLDGRRHFHSHLMSVGRRRRRAALVCCVGSQPKTTRQQHKPQCYTITVRGLGTSSQPSSPPTQEGDKGTPKPDHDNDSISNTPPVSPQNTPRSPPPTFRQVLQHYQTQLQTIPNLLALSRIAMAPCIGYWIIMDQMTIAGATCIVAGLTDVLDGAIARTWPDTQASTLGTYLDPLADKILINTVATALAVSHVLPVPLVALWWTKDVVLVVGTYRHVSNWTIQRSTTNEQTTTSTTTTRERAWWHVLDPLHIPLTILPTLTSKVNTGGQFLTLAVALYSPTATWLLTPLVYGTAMTTILSVASYYNYNAFSITPPKK